MLHTENTQSLSLKLIKNPIKILNSKLKRHSFEQLFFVNIKLGIVDPVKQVFPFIQKVAIVPKVCLEIFLAMEILDLDFIPGAHKTTLT